MDDNLYVQTEELRKTLKSKGVKDREIEEMLLQQKRKYIYSLYDYMKFMKRKEDFNANKASTARQKNFSNKMKAMKIYKERVEDELKNEALSMQFKVRDEQANYMRAMYIPISLIVEIK